jgi:DHA1 family tetracycline resistance protein-like MFS transporter
MVGISLSVVGIMVALVQGGLIRYTSKLLGNEKSVFIGLLMYATGMFLFAFASQSWMMYAFLIPYCMGGIAGPALQSIITSHVPANEQGELQGALTSLMSVTSIFGPILMTNLFYYFTSSKTQLQFPGVSFFVGGLMMLGSCVVSYLALKNESHAIITE